MKKIALAAVVASLIGSSAFAGNIIEPIIEPQVIVEQTTSSSASGLIVPLLMLAVIAATFAN